MGGSLLSGSLGEAAGRVTCGCLCCAATREPSWTEGRLAHHSGLEEEGQPEAAGTEPDGTQKPGERTAGDW